MITEYILGICCHCNLSLKMRHEHGFPQPTHMPAVGATLVNTSRSVSGPRVSLPFLGCGSGNFKNKLALLSQQSRDPNSRQPHRISSHVLSGSVCNRIEGRKDMNVYELLRNQTLSSLHDHPLLHTSDYKIWISSWRAGPTPAFKPHCLTCTDP